MKKTITIFITLAIVAVLNAQHTASLNANQNNYIQTFGGGIGKNTFLKFDISSIPSNAIITNVQFNAYVFNSQPSWDADAKYIRYNNQTWLETDSNQYIWNTSLFTDTIIQLGGFGAAVGFSQSPDLTNLFMADFSLSNSYFSFFMKDPDDPTGFPMMPGASFTNTDSMLVGNIFGNRTAFRPRLYANPNQRPYLTVSYGLPPTASLLGSGVYCEGNTNIMNASVIGDGPFTYQWYYNGSPIGGETGSSYTTLPLQPSDSGNYSFVVIGPYGTDTSNLSHIDVEPMNLPLLGPDVDTCENQTIHLDAGAGYVTYTWSVGLSTTQLLDVDTALTGPGSTSINLTVLTVNGCFGYDTVTVTFSNCGSGLADNIDPTTFDLYPNPHDGHFNLALHSSGIQPFIQILNIQGQVLRTIMVPSSELVQTIPFDLSSLPDGIYFVHLTGNGSTTIQKTIKN